MLTNSTLLAFVYRIVLRIFWYKKSFEIEMGNSYRVFSGLSKFVAETKWENKLLGQGDAAEHQFHAWVRDERCIRAERTRWKLPVVLWRAIVPKPRLYWVLRVAEFSAHSSWPRRTEWPEILLHNGRGQRLSRLDPARMHSNRNPAPSRRMFPGAWTAWGTWQESNRDSIIQYFFYLSPRNTTNLIIIDFPLFHCVKIFLIIYTAEKLVLTISEPQ